MRKFFFNSSEVEIFEIKSRRNDLKILIQIHHRFTQILYNSKTFSFICCSEIHLLIHPGLHSNRVVTFYVQNLGKNY